MVAVAPAADSGAAAASESRLKLTEIFHSLQGEADAVGWPTVFVRLTGCPLRCTYCDTAYAFYGGEWWTLEAVLARVASFGARHVCVTGGEPLAQRASLALMRALCDAGYHSMCRRWMRAWCVSSTSRRPTRTSHSAIFSKTSRC